MKFHPEELPEHSGHESHSSDSDELPSNWEVELEKGKTFETPRSAPPHIGSPEDGVIIPSTVLDQDKSDRQLEKKKLKDTMRAAIEMYDQKDSQGKHGKK